MPGKFDWKALVICLLAVYAFAALGSIFTFRSVNSPWYDSIKPTITPPNWVFPVVWNILFLLIAASLFLLWTARFRNKKHREISRKRVALAFGINLFLNTLWSALFFGLKSPAASLFELAVLWISIIAMIFTAYRIRKISAYLLLPYGLWVIFAGILNAIIVFI